MISPFEQFEIHRIVPIRLGETLDISVTNSAIYMGIAVGVYMLLYKVNIEGGIKRGIHAHTLGKDQASLLIETRFMGAQEH